MAFAQGSRSYLAYITEVTFGTTPGSPQLTRLPINTHSLGLNKSVIESGEIRPDRQVAVSRHGNRNAVGDILVEFRAGDYDPLLESALFGAFSSGTLKLGVTPKYFTMEDGMTDVPAYRTFKGLAVNTFRLQVRPNAIVQATFGMVGRDAPPATASPLDATLTEPSANIPFDSFSGTITEGGVAIASVTGLDLTVENSLAPTMVIGTPLAPQLEYGRGRVTGEITVYVENITLYNKFVNETSSTLVFSLTDGTATYTFTLPKIKYNGADVPLANEQSRIITMPIQALYDATEATTLKIVKT